MQYFTILLIIRISSKTSVLTKNTSHLQSMQPFLDTTIFLRDLVFPSTVSRVGRGKIDRSQQYLQYMVYRVSKIKSSHQKSILSHKENFVKDSKIVQISNWKGFFFDTLYYLVVHCSSLLSNTFTVWKFIDSSCPQFYVKLVWGEFLDTESVP